MSTQFVDTDAIQTLPVRLTISQHFGDHDFPLVISNQSTQRSGQAVREWIRVNQGAIEQAHDDVGAIMFRNFGMRNDQEFDEFVRSFDYPNFTYQDSLSNAVRVNRSERVFTANEAPPDVDIVMHHEMAQTPIYPSRLLFFCEKAAEHRGQTPLCRSDVLFERLAADYPQFTADCETLGLRYTNEMPAEPDAQSGQGRSWRSTMNADSRDDAEARLGKLGYQWSWQTNGDLRATTPVLPAVRTLADGRKTFFNQLISAAYGWKAIDGEPAVTYGDGSPLPRGALDRAIALAEELAFDTPWQDGDAVLINNYLVMHGRRPFAGTRRVLASLVQ